MVRHVRTRADNYHVTSTERLRPLPTVSSRENPWSLEAFPGVLPVLPHGELTVIRIRDDEGSTAWWGTVGRLIEEALTAGQTVDLVRVDGVVTEDLQQMIDWNDGSGLLNVIDDADLVVRPWHQHLRGHGYACNVPTLHNVHAAIGPVGSNQAGRLLVLDHFQRARPWGGESAPTYPGAATIDPSLIDQERAGQIHALARLRRHAPTVVVWHNSVVGRPEALDSLLDDTRLALEYATDADGRGFIRAFVRKDLAGESAFDKADQ